MPQLKSCIYTFYGCINLKKIFRDTQRINSLFPYKDRLNHSLKSKLVYKASCQDCDDFYIGKTKRRLHDRKISKHSRRIVKHPPLRITLLQLDTILSRIISVEILATGRSDIHCRIKESEMIKDLKPSLNENVGSEKLFLYQPFIYFPAGSDMSVYYLFFTIVLIRFQSFALAFKSRCILSNRHF